LGKRPKSQREMKKAVFDKGSMKSIVRHQLYLDDDTRRTKKNRKNITHKLRTRKRNTGGESLMKGKRKARKKGNGVTSQNPPQRGNIHFKNQEGWI